MRLTLLVDSPSKRAHGNAASRLALGLVQTGEAEPTMLCYGDDPRPSWLPAEVPVDYLGINRASRAILPIARYLGSHQPDVLITRQIHTNLCSLPAAGLARRFYGWQGKLVLVQDHPIALSHAADWRDNKRLSKIGYRFASGVISPSPAVRDDIIRWCNLAPESVALVPNAIPPFPGLLATPPHPWLFEGEPPLFVHISNLTPWKRLDLLVGAFAELSRSEEVGFILVGLGPGGPVPHEQIRRLGLTSRAQAVGWVDDPLQYAGRACALVHPSDEEGFGQVLTEAMSAGCPVITTDARGGGPRYITQDGHFGMLIPRDDTPALTAAMRSALQPEVRARYSYLGLERSKAFAPAICADALTQFLVKQLSVQP